MQSDADGNAVAAAPEAEEQLPSLAHVLAFPLSAWLLFLICAFFYQGVLTFYQVASDIMQKTGHRFEPNTASMFLSIPNFVSIVASPTFGRLVDRNGRALMWIIIASWVMVLVHLGMLANAYAVVFIHPVIIMLVLGFAYALGAASMWPILSLIIPKHMVSTGYGTMTAVQNLALAVFPLVISSIQGMDGIAHTRLQYSTPILIFIFCVSVSSMLAAVLLAVDKSRNKGILNASAQEREEMLREQEALDAAAAANKTAVAVGHAEPVDHDYVQ